MLIELQIENWMSFRDKTVFSTAASRERQHGERLPQLSKYKLKILPVAAIYGANASGKTAFFRAMSFVKDLVVDGTRPDAFILVEPFKLQAKYKDSPSKFSFSILVEDRIHIFSFSVTRKTVLEEKLTEIQPAGEKVLYHRKSGKCKFDSALPDQKFLQFAFQGTRENQLFLTNAISQKVETFRPVFDWFDDTLELVSPDSQYARFDQFLDEEHSLYTIMNAILPKLDTGIHSIGGEEVPFDSILIPENFKTEIREKLKAGDAARIEVGRTSERIIITRQEGEISAKKLVTFHTSQEGEEIKFDLRQESDGSQRLLDLLPAFFAICAKNSKKVFVIDELDRSLHTLMTRRLVQLFLTSCSPNSRAQLFLTTHDVMLMDQEILRRDEMWITEKSKNGASTLHSFSEYKDVRSDKDIQKSYLQGRMGGIPKVLVNTCLTDIKSMSGQD